MGRQVTELSENTSLTIPIRNIVAMIAFTVVSTTAFFTLQERVNGLEHTVDKAQVEINQNSEFRIRWPRGEMGSLPADARQDMLLEYYGVQQTKELDLIERVRDEIHELKLRIAALEQNIEFKEVK